MHVLLKALTASGLSVLQKSHVLFSCCSSSSPPSFPSSTFHLIATQLQSCLLLEAFIIFPKWLGDPVSALLTIFFYVSNPPHSEKGLRTHGGLFVSSSGLIIILHFCVFIWSLSFCLARSLDCLSLYPQHRTQSIFSKCLLDEFRRQSMTAFVCLFSAIMSFFSFPFSFEVFRDFKRPEHINFKKERKTIRQLHGFKLRCPQYCSTIIATSKNNC